MNIEDAKKAVALSGRLAGLDAALTKIAAPRPEDEGPAHALIGIGDVVVEIEAGYAADAIAQGTTLIQAERDRIAAAMAALGIQGQ